MHALMTAAFKAEENQCHASSSENKNAVLFFFWQLGTVWMPKFLAKRYCNIFVVI
jgi:hypothetical protein